MVSFEELQHKAYVNDVFVDRYGSRNRYTYRIMSKASPNVHGEQLLATASSLDETDKILSGMRKKYLGTLPKEEARSIARNFPMGKPKRGDYWGEGGGGHKLSPILEKRIKLGELTRAEAIQLKNQIDKNVADHVMKYNKYDISTWNDAEVRAAYAAINKEPSGFTEGSVDAIRNQHKKRFG